MNKLPLSVIMPAYNEEKTISRAIESILNQTFTDFELIIIDDCSSDNTPNIIKKYTDKRIRYYRNNENKGVAKSLNAGIEMSRGVYLARMDADDLSSPERFEIQLKFMEENIDVGLVGSYCYLIMNGNESEPLSCCPPLDHENIIKFFKRDNPFIHSSVMMRKTVLDEIGHYKVEKGMEDYDLFIRFAKICRTMNLPHMLVTRYDDNNFLYKKTYEGLKRYHIYKKRLFYQRLTIKEFGFSKECIWYLGKTVIRMVMCRIGL